MPGALLELQGRKVTHLQRAVTLLVALHAEFDRRSVTAPREALHHQDPQRITLLGHEQALPQ